MVVCEQVELVVAIGWWCVRDSPGVGGVDGEGHAVVFADAGTEPEEGLAFDPIQARWPASAPTMVIADDEPVFPFADSFECVALSRFDGHATGCVQEARIDRDCSGGVAGQGLHELARARAEAVNQPLPEFWLFTDKGRGVVID